MTIASPPSITFAVSDGAATNNPIIGLGWTAKNSTDMVPGLTNMAFSLAKLVPGTDGAPSKWVSYIVTTEKTYKSATDTTQVDPVPTRPTTDHHGTLVDNKNGTYTYTFYRDITKVKDIVAAATLTAPNVAADLGDLTYDPTLTHRLTLYIGGAHRGTGTNTADGSDSGVTTVYMENPVNIVYDFIPATGKAVSATDTQREVVAIANCNECHRKLEPHSGRVDTRYCVVCHTEQRKYGRAAVSSTAGKFPALKETATQDATTGITSFSYAPSTYVGDGEVMGNFTTLVHKIHNGKELVKENYNYANIVFNNKGYSMIGGGQEMCTKCHDNTKAAQADNYKNVPTRLACGACHDGIDWASGKGSTLADKAAAGAVGAVLASSGHVGGAQKSDKLCALCHSADAVTIYHQTLNVTPHNPTVATGLANFTYDVASAAVDATSNNVTIKFRILQYGKAVTFLAPAAAMANPLTGFTGSPGFILAYAANATATDGIASPVDYTNSGVAQAQAIRVSIADLLNTAKATTTGTMVAGTGADAGYYIATLLGSGSDKKFFPVGAKLRSAALQGYFTQVSPAAPRHAIAVVKAVTGDAARRTVVDKTKCANCHEWFEGHGGNRVYETQVCVMCHVPGLATSGRGTTQAQLKAYAFTTADVKILNDWGIDVTTFGSGVNDALKYPVTTNNFKDLIHGIHAGRERVTPFKDARNRSGTQTLLDLRRMDFPGMLNNCETCHAAGTYSSVPLNTLPSTYETIDTAYDAAITAGTQTSALALGALKTTSANATDHVVTPFAAACGSCHDSVGAQAHFKTQGGLINVNRSSVIGSGEACALCHGTGRSEDVAVVHKK